MKLTHTQFFRRIAQRAAFLKVIWSQNTPLNFSLPGRGGGAEHTQAAYVPLTTLWEALDWTRTSSVAFQTTRLSHASTILGCNQHRFNSESQMLRLALGNKDEWSGLEELTLWGGREPDGVDEHCTPIAVARALGTEGKAHSAGQGVGEEEHEEFRYFL